MRAWFLFAASVCLGVPATAQLPTCSAPVWSPCDLVFPLQPGEDPAKVQLRAEFRSPRRDTRAIHGFVEGDRAVLRFTPNQAGDWDYRVSSNLGRLDGQVGKASGTDSSAPGFVRVANVHHFQTSNLAPHLWMASAIENFATMPRAEFDAAVAAGAAGKFTHLRVTLEPSTDLREAAERIRAIHDRGLVTDLVLASIPEARQERERYLTEIAARFAAFNITWAGVPAFEDLPNSRAVLREAGELLANVDPYQHPRTTLARTTSFGMAEDGWMDFASYGTADPNVGAVEHQLARIPAVNAGIRSRADLWNATMNGQYPGSGSGPELAVWFEFFSRTRYWELEPYFGVTGGRALAIRDVELGREAIQDAVEYIVYLETPQPVTLNVQKQNYDVEWLNPATGQRVKAKNFKEEEFQATPPDTSHDWVLHLSREGHKEDLLKRYKFESRPVERQQPEAKADAIPFAVLSPMGEIPLGGDAMFQLEVQQETRSTRQLLVVWTAELVSGGDGSRVVGVGRQGALQVPDAFAAHAPALLTLRATILNGNGKLYMLDQVVRLAP